jgi:serine/threonine protein kinase
MKNLPSLTESKCENIIIDKKAKNILLIDFGLCSVNDYQNKLHIIGVGSPQYSPPEILSSKPYNSFKVDVFCAGVVLYCMLFAQFPYINKDRIEQIKNGTKLKVPFHEKKISKKATDLISRMLEDDPEKRITLKHVAEHKWLA